MRNIRSAIAGILALIAVSPAFGQGGVANFPQTVPAQTLVGRLGITPGPTSAIPITSLATVFGAKQSVTTNAKCDGATDDTAAINADLAKGGYWTLPPNKTCNVTQLNITVSGTRISGSGFNTSIIQGTTASAPTINISASLSNIYLDGFQVTKSGIATTGGTGIKANGDCQYCIIDGVFVQKHFVGIALQSTGVGYIRHVLAQLNLSDGITFTNSSVSGTLQWDLDDVFSGQNAGRGYLVASGSGSGAISLGNWQNVRTFANSGVGAAFVGTAIMPINGVRIARGFLGQDGNHEIFLDTFGGLHTINATYAELAGTSATGPALSTPASNVGDGIRITANNIDVTINGAYINGNHDSGINTSATAVTSVNGSHVTNHGIDGILAANCAILTATGDFFASNTSGNVVCTSNSGSQIISGSLPGSLNTVALSTVTGLGTGVATALGNAVNASGGFVTFNGALGTPTSGTLTNATGLPIGTGISGLGSGVATFLGTPNSANLRAAITDETGIGLAVFNNGPALISPTITGPAVAGGVRIPLTANTTFNVATTGTDSNNCTSGAPCLTIQRAYDNLANFYDLQGFTATIQLANGTYTAGLITAKCVPGQNGPAGVQILGSAAPATVLISVTNNDAIGLGELATGAGTQGCTQITVGGMKLVTITSGNSINVSGGGVGITVGTPGFPMEFGASAQNHMVGNHGAWLIAGTNNIISGNAVVAHVAGLSAAQMALHNTCEFINGALTMQYYALADTGSPMFVEGMVWNSGSCAAGSGSITTSVGRYLVQNFATIYTLSASATYLPGSTSGIVQSLGNYVTNVPSVPSLPAMTIALGSNVALSNTATYFDGPSVAQGTTGTWFASGTVTLADVTASAPRFDCKLWDGTTVIAAASITPPGTSNWTQISLSGFLASPAANIRISCKETATTGNIFATAGDGTAKASTISAFRLN